MSQYASPARKAFNTAMDEIFGAAVYKSKHEADDSQVQEERIVGGQKLTIPIANLKSRQPKDLSYRMFLHAQALLMHWVSNTV